MTDVGVSVITWGCTRCGKVFGGAVIKPEDKDRIANFFLEMKMMLLCAKCGNWETAFKYREDANEELK